MTDLLQPVVQVRDPYFHPVHNCRKPIKKPRLFLFAGTKFAFDRSIGLMAVPVVALVSLVLLALNPFLNPGPLFYAQIRMGKRGRPFVMYKFRSMLPAERVVRHHGDGVEDSRITPLGRILRKHRIDELPNLLNVLRGNMSVIGPRPDAWSHARHYQKTIPDYARRHGVRPGISGLAQVKSGYTDCADSTRLKVAHDLEYIHNYGFRQEARIILATFRVIATGHGAK